MQSEFYRQRLPLGIRRKSSSLYTSKLSVGGSFFGETQKQKKTRRCCAFHSLFIGSFEYGGAWRGAAASTFIAPTRGCPKCRLSMIFRQADGDR